MLGDVGNVARADPQSGPSAERRGLRIGVESCYPKHSRRRWHSVPDASGREAGNVDYQEAIRKLTSWASDNDGVRAMVLTGSAAAHQSHPLSDRDIEIYATEPARLLEDDSWWDQLGDVLVVERLPNPGWHPTRLVYYAGGKLDFTVIRADALSTSRHDRPFTVLLDKDGLAHGLSQVAPEVSLPDEPAFDERLNWGYAAALMEAKAIVRDEPWSAKFRDGDLKEALLMLIEWEHHVRYGLDYDVRFLGSRMRQWMDPDVQEDLERCWGHFDARDSSEALLSSISLLGKVAKRIAEGLHFEPFDHDRLRQEVESILAGKWGGG